jgi:type I restriction enzyme, S subunit
VIDGLRPYPEMKPTGLPWLAELPTMWEIHRAKYSFHEADDRSAQGDEELLSVSHKTGVTPRSQKTITMFMAESYEGHKVCRPGDVVVNTMWAWMAAVGVSRHVGIVSPAYGIYRPRTTSRFEPRYLDYLLRTEAYRAEYLRSSRGVTTSRLRLYPPDFLNIPFVQPPLDEQRLIVRFLDWHGGQTAKLIRAKKKLIALLNEQKQTIIHHAVTRGLDPNVKLRPSGIPWLGDIPEGWDVAALRHRYDQCLGKMLDTKRITGAHLLPYLRNTDVQWERINVVDLPMMDVPPEEYERYKLRLGDLLVCEGGEVGRAAIWSGELDVCAFQKALHRLRPRNPSRDNPRFLILQLRLAVALGAFVDGHESTIAHLTGEKLRAHRFLFPPFAEQLRIIVAIDNQSLELDNAIDRIEREIALLQEFRTRLIADVVTGKLDVRRAAASLPEVTELEPIDEPADGEDVEETTDDAENEEVAA